MPAGRDTVVVPATLDNVRNGSAIDLEIGGKVPAEVRRPDHNQTTTRVSRSLARRKSGDENKNKNKSADVTG